MLLVAGHRKSCIDSLICSGKAIISRKKSQHRAVLGVRKWEVNSIVGVPRFSQLWDLRSEVFFLPGLLHYGNKMAAGIPSQSLTIMLRGTKRDDVFPWVSISSLTRQLLPVVPQKIYLPSSFQSCFLCLCLEEKEKGSWLLTWTNQSYTLTQRLVSTFLKSMATELLGSSS